METGESPLSSVCVWSEDEVLHNTVTVHYLNKRMSKLMFRLIMATFRREHVSPSVRKEAVITIMTN